MIHDDVTHPPTNARHFGTKTLWT